MGVQIIAQPDGLFCVYSSSSNTIIVWNATEEELVEHYAREAMEKARRSVSGIIDRVKRDQARTVYHQFTLTYAEAVAATQAQLAKQRLPAGVREGDEAQP